MALSPLRQTPVQHVQPDVHLDSRHVWSEVVCWEKHSRPDTHTHTHEQLESIKTTVLDQR